MTGRAAPAHAPRCLAEDAAGNCTAIRRRPLRRTAPYDPPTPLNTRRPATTNINIDTIAHRCSDLNHAVFRRLVVNEVLDNVILDGE